jgi:4-hydroxy 2-oxovalerate aldolase
MNINLIDCTLRDGGYYNNWDFSRELIVEYLTAMEAVSVNYVELGFRSFDAVGFLGACAYTTDRFINNLPIPWHSPNSVDKYYCQNLNGRNANAKSQKHS